MTSTMEELEKKEERNKKEEEGGGRKSKGEGIIEWKFLD